MNKYQVTQDHINSGKKDDCWFCPVALAFKEHVGGRISVSRGFMSCSIPLTEYARDYGIKIYNFSNKLRAWIMKFDECRPVDPITIVAEGTKLSIKGEAE